MTVEREAPQGAERSVASTIIPFRGASSPRLRDAIPAFAPQVIRRARTLRLVDILLLLPIIVPLTAIILLALLGWFVCWLIVVGLLTTAIVLADIGHCLLMRLYPRSIRALDPRPVSYQGL